MSLIKLIVRLLLLPGLLLVGRSAIAWTSPLRVRESGLDLRPDDIGRMAGASDLFKRARLDYHRGGDVDRLPIQRAAVQLPGSAGLSERL